MIYHRTRKGRGILLPGDTNKNEGMEYRRYWEKKLRR